MNNIAIILRKPPYGDINAAEAVRHAMGAVSDDIGVSFIMVDSGVLLAIKKQEPGESGFMNLGDVLNDCIGMGINVYADKTSMNDHHLDSTDIIEGVKLINGTDISEIIKEAHASMIF